MNATIPREVAARVASAAASIDGVCSALVCSADGAVLASAEVPDPAREAALASFAAIRAEALPVDGDLRGMGRQLAGSHFSHMAIAHSRAESLLYNLTAGAYLMVRIAPGRGAAAAGPLATLVRRVSTLPESSMRSPQP